mmetsp:Transcript_19168/g.28390  ORF Transcript_19168/g.28390 Transcript_19168/m.28390 type:complete len:752 (-) Transcript_19168:118-2373(-)|eukprot:CAMPEP_0194043728 /NCGR_PEP_ID=MMETSP0009_2-20130614/15303_1 /TAXON_ID=210454 /ORGANISM="Grammatophora oceanica, Strain CCMP 410" /LENGTH=751 /DNA_ID=CAMNT_0038688039 /DNA_START=278 /DNA_END=2533 /DNA_ORIENTATION=+
MKSELRIIASVALLVNGANAFAPSAKSAKMPQVGARRTLSARTNVAMVEQLNLEDPMALPTPSPPGNDDNLFAGGPALLFDGESSQLTKNFLSQEDGDPIVTVGPSLTATETTHDDVAQEVILASVANLHEEKVRLEMEKAVAKEDTADTLGAVLAASQQAVKEAEEATREIPRTIPLIPGNNTFGTSEIIEKQPAVKVDDPPPTVGKILKFAVPAIGVWLCSPLLSLIDTSAVGLLSGTAQQAALNPAVAVTDYAALLIAFMYTGATNLVAAAQEDDRGLEAKPKASRAMITAIQLSGYVGASLGAILFTFARPLLRAMIGNDGIAPEVFTAAMKYVRIRALGMPAAAVIGSAQASCLGLQDIRSPLYVLAAAAVVNFFGDMTFVGSAHPWIGGAAGAAWATVFSQYAAVAFFVRWLCTRPRNVPGSKPSVNLTNNIMELMGRKGTQGSKRRKSFKAAAGEFQPLSNKGKSVTAKLSTAFNRFRGNNKKKSTPVRPTADLTKESFSTRGFLNGKMTPLDMLKFPSKENAKEFGPYVAPVTATQVGRVSGYVAMSHVVSSSLGTYAMAAQQVIVSLFYCLCPIADSLSLTAQSFVPAIAGRRKSKERAAALAKTRTNLFKAGGVFGAAMVAAVLAIPLISRFFTTDPVVVGLVNSVAPYLVGFFSVHGVTCAAEGLLMGQKDLNFLGQLYGAFFFAVPFVMLRIKRAALAGASRSLTSVWSVFAGYQMIRSLTWVLRSFQLQRRTDAEARP